LYWRNSINNTYASWDLNAAGALVTGRVLKAAELYQAEVALGFDITGDSEVGLQFSGAPISSNGDIALGLIAQPNFGYGIQAADGAVTPISYSDGYAGSNNPGAGWAAIGINPTASGSTLYWQNSINNTYASWDLNAAGALVTGRVLKAAELYQAEVGLGFDITGDSEVGLQFSGAPISSNGDIALGLIAQPNFGYGIQAADGAVTPISYAGGYAGSNNPGAGWAAIGINPTASGSTLYWRNSINNTYASWGLNAAGALVTGRVLKAAELYQAEVALGFDITGDSEVGLQFSGAPISSNGDIALGVIAQPDFGYGIQVGNGAITPISYSGGYAGSNNPGAGWAAIGINPTASGSTLYWRNSINNTYASWDLNAAGALVTGRVLKAAELYQAEVGLGFDITGDSEVGLQFSGAPISSNGDIALGLIAQPNFGYGIQAADGQVTPISYSGGYAGINKPGAGWQAIAAAAGDSSLELFWRNGSSIAKWDLDSTGQLISGELLTGSSLAVEEQQLGINLNQDALTGFSFNSLSVSSTADLGETQFGYGIQLATGNIVPITYGNGIDASPLSPGSGWNAVAAATSRSNFDVYWKNAETYAKWTIDAEGALIPGGGSLLDASLIPQEELLIGDDINGDDAIGFAV
jgi:hypothetical protein